MSTRLPNAKKLRAERVDVAVVVVVVVVTKGKKVNVCFDLPSAVQACALGRTGQWCAEGRGARRANRESTQHIDEGGSTFFRRALGCTEYLVLGVGA